MAVMELWRRRDLEGTVKTEYIDGNFFNQDNAGNRVGVKVYKDGAEVVLTGSVTGYCVLPSGETVSVAGTRSGNQASILVPQSALAYTGPLGITLKLIDGNTITTLMSIIVVVYRSKTDTVITPSSQIITDWANQISAALQEVEDASAAQDQKIADLKSAIDGSEEYYETITMTSGYYIKSGNVYNVDLTPIAYASSQYAIVDCAPGDTFVLNGIQSNNYDRAWVFIGNNNNNVITPTAGTGVISGTIIAPAGAVKVIFNDTYPSTGTIQKYHPETAGVRNEIANLKADTKEDFIRCENAYNAFGVAYEIIPNSYVNSSTGAFTPIYDATYPWDQTDYIKIDRGIPLVIITTRQGIDNAYYTENKTFISNFQLVVGENMLDIPDNAAYMAISTRSVDLANLSIKKLLPEHSVNEACVKHQAAMIYNNNNYGACYYVGNGADYSTINDALTAWENDNYPAATIFIGPGEYKEAVTIEEGHVINLIGSGVDSTIIHTTSGNYVDAPITIFHGTVNVRNMTLIADHTENPDFDHEQPQYLKAYGIHIDHGTVGGVVTVENCKIISYQAPAVGTGTIPNSKIRLINCDCYSFTAYTDDTSTHQYYQLHNGAILWHTSNAGDYPNRGSESFEMVNVRAFNKNDYSVLRLVNNQDGETMPLLSINVTLIKGTDTWQNAVLGTPLPVTGSRFNNNTKLDYKY